MPILSQKELWESFGILMIPKKSTPIKNEILIDIFARGLLNKDEMRIIFYIIRWSWGFDGVGRRQDWTLKLKKKNIAEDIGMLKSHVCEIVNKMILDNKIIVKDKCYQFNEHYEEWRKFPKKELLRNDKEVPEKGIRSSRIRNFRHAQQSGRGHKK